MKKEYIILQDGIKECGSACLTSIIKYYGGNVPMSRILEMTKTTKKGTNFYNIACAANEIGLTAKGYNITDINRLFTLDKPLICQTLVKNYYHFVVIYKINENYITLMDPSIGMKKMKLEQFKKIYTGNILTLVPYKRLPIYKDNNYLSIIIKEVIKNNINLIISIMLLATITIIFTCLYSFNFKIIIDNIIKASKLKLNIIFSFFLIISFIKIVANYLRQTLVIVLNKKIDMSIMTTTIEKIIFLPYSYYKNKTTGEMISRINDLMYLKEIVLKLITSVFLDLILSVAVVFILFSMNKIMTIYSFIIIILYFLVFTLYYSPIKNLTNELQSDNARTNTALLESLSSYESIKGLNLETKIINKLNNQYRGNINKRNNLLSLLNSNDFLKNVIDSIGVLFIVKTGVAYVMDGLMSVGTLITYHTLLFYYMVPIKNSLDFYKDIYYVKNSIRRINNILNFKYERLDENNESSLCGSIHINNLSFDYLGDKPVLEKVNLTIPNKSKTLIFGSSGSGKSTLLKLIYRYYQIDNGTIFIDNNDINNIPLSTIRKNITYISQNEFLYTDTIKNNIIMLRNVSETKFNTVCKLTHINDFVKDNPLLYNLVLEENGANISGGQRQRIILSRALLKESNIILIDEGLNEIDVKLEREILTSIFSCFKDKTIIIVSHRLSNIDLYSQVIHFESGMAKEVISSSSRKEETWN